MGLSFKKDKKETGLAAIGNSYPSVDIKLDKKKVGYIRPPRALDQNVFSINLAVKKVPTEDSPASFGWVTLKQKFECDWGRGEKEARKYLKENWERITKTFDLYQFED